MYRTSVRVTRNDARSIVKACSSCITFLHPPHVGINPRGLRPNALWQMDITHVLEFGRIKYLHVSVDTYSGVIFATPLAGEKSIHVKTHCLEAWAAWGKPVRLKTDNGPAYSSKGFRAFCAQLQVEHTFGLPYNPQGQGIVERANRSLKELLQKQRGGMAETASPRNRIAMALFTLNFLIMDDKGRTAADRHAHTSPEGAGKVMWKDVLDNKWYGPDPVIRRSRGAICVFPQDREVPHWVPSRLTRTVEVHHENDSAALQDADTADPVEDDATAVPDDDGGDNPDSGRAEMGNIVCLP